MFRSNLVGGQSKQKKAIEAEIEMVKFVRKIDMGKIKLVSNKIREIFSPHTLNPHLHIIILLF